MSCGVICRCRSDVALLWLWHRLRNSSHSAPSLGTSTCRGCGPKRTKKKKRKTFACLLPTCSRTSFFSSMKKKPYSSKIFLVTLGHKDVVCNNVISDRQLNKTHRLYYCQKIGKLKKKIQIHKKCLFLGFPIVVQQKQIQQGTMRFRVQFLALLSGLRIWCCHELWYRSQMWLGSGVAVAVV